MVLIPIQLKLKSLIWERCGRLKIRQLDYFEKEYGFKPSPELLEKFQKSALKFGGGCSASFVSEDGLIMTNHHCVRGILPNLHKDDENILRDGFFAKTLGEERMVPNLKVEQLIIIKDVTK